MKKTIKISQAVFFLLSCALLLLGTMHYFYVGRTENQIRARYGENTVYAEKIEQYYEQQEDKKPGNKKSVQNIPDVTLWRLKEQEVLTSGEYFKAEGFTIIEGYGNLEKILPGQKTEGMYPPKGDTDGCAISDKGARELFGSSDVLGKEVSMDGKEYIIRGIIKDERKMLWIQNPDAEGFPYVEMSYQKKISASAAEEWLVQQGYGKPEAVLAGCDYLAFNFLFLTLPVWVFAFGISRKLKNHIRNVRTSYFRTALFLIWGVGVAALVLVGIRLSFRFSLDYIPPKWSDFGFFSDKVTQLAKAAGNIARLEPLPGDTELIQHSKISAYYARGSLGCMMGAAILDIISGRVCSTEKGKEEAAV